MLNILFSDRVLCVHLTSFTNHAPSETSLLKFKSTIKKSTPSPAPVPAPKKQAAKPKKQASKPQARKGAALSPQLTVQKIAQAQKKKPSKKVASKEPAKKIDVPPVKGRPTFSLFGLGGGTGPSAPEPASTPKAKSVSKTASAPRGVPTIANWKLLSDNTISGLISGSSSFKDGSPVTTSVIIDKASSNSVVRTKSGSR